MDSSRRKRLEAAGFAVGSAQELLGLSDAEAGVVEVKLLLSDRLRARRTEQGLTQSALAARLGSSQSRVAKMEAGDPSVSLDLLVRALFATGAGRQEIADAIAPRRGSRAA